MALAILAAGCDSGGDTPDDPTTVAGSSSGGSSSTDDSGSTTGPPDTTGPAPTSTPPPTSDTITTSPTSDSGGTGGSGLTFQYDVLPIFEAANCGRTTCHGAQFPEVTEYYAIVNAPSTVTGVDLVKPGSRDESYLWLRLNGTGSSVGGINARMPQGGSLPAADIELIGEWIDAGAAP
jgi:hypothetical protein